MLLSQYQRTWKHICKLESEGHYEISLFVHIYQLLFIVLYLICSFYKLLVLRHLVFQTCLLHLYLIIYPFLLKLFTSIRIFSAFNWRSYISLFHGFIYSILLFLLTLCDISFSWTVNMSYFALLFPIIISSSCLTMFSTQEEECFLTKLYSLCMR